MNVASLAPSAEPSAHDRLLALAALVGSGSLLGLSTILAKLALATGMSPAHFLALSAAGAASLLWLLQILRGNVGDFRAGLISYSSIAAALSLVVPNIIMLAVIPHVGAGFVALTLTFPPVLTYALSLLVRVEQLQITRVLGTALALAGALILGLNKVANGDHQPGWVALSLLVPVSLALGNVYRTLRWPAGASSEMLAAPMLTVSAAAFGIYAIVLPLFDTQFRSDLPTAAMWSLVIAQSVTFALQYQLFFVVQRKGGPLVISLLGSVAALFAVPAAYFLLDESFPVGLGPASLLIACGVALVIGGRSKPADS